MDKQIPNVSIDQSKFREEFKKIQDKHTVYFCWTAIIVYPAWVFLDYFFAYSVWEFFLL